MSYIKIGTVVMVIRGPHTGKVGEVIKHGPDRPPGLHDHLVEFPSPLRGCVMGEAIGPESRRLWSLRRALMPLPPLSEPETLIESMPVSTLEHTK